MVKTVGGTMVSRILGISRWGGPLSAYYELTGETPPDDVKLSHQERGNALEASVLAMLEERYPGSELLDGGRVHDAERMPHAHATLDALWRPPDAGPVVIPDAKTLAREAMGEDWGPDGTDQIPVEYQLQLLWYLGVCKAAGMSVTAYALLPTLVGPEAELQWAARLVKATGRPLSLVDLDGTGLELRVYRVEWNDELFELVNARVLRFLREHVEPRVPPPAEDELTERDMKAVRGLKASPGQVLDFERLPPPEQALVLEALEATRQRRQWEDLEEQAAARVRLVLGGAEELRGLPGGARITWRARADGVRVFKIMEARRR